MKYYEVKDPYYALIHAKDEKQAIELYNEIVCEVEDNDDIEIHRISKLKALIDYIKSCLIEKSTIKESIEYYLCTRNSVVLVDRTL